MVAENLGSVSSLRARLLKIREKTKPVTETLVQSSQEESSPRQSVLLNIKDIFDDDLSAIRDLMGVSTQIAEDDSRLLACVESLKRFHAALSRQQNPVLGLTSGSLAQLRECIIGNLNTGIELMTK